MKIERLFDILKLYQDNYAYKTDAFARKTNGDWTRYSAKDYVEYVNSLSYGLLALGLKPGDNVATLSNNRPEWNFIDMALAQTGMVHVPVYPTLSADDHLYILRDAEVKAIFISDKSIMRRIAPILQMLPPHVKIFAFNDDVGVSSWLEVVELGHQQADKFKDRLEKIKSEISEHDLLTLIYTSGTTGNPKGVMLSHANILSNSKTTAGMLPLEHTQRAFSFLPLCHVYERMMNYNFQINGLSIYYAESLGTISQNILDIKPHVFNTVPRLMEKVYDTIMAKGKDLRGVKKLVFEWANYIALHYDFPEKTSFWYRFRLSLADKLVLKYWREGLGGNIRLLVSGGSPLQTRLQRVFWACKMPVYEGYGLSESSPVIAVNDPRSNEGVCFGTVGPILDGVEVKLADDGEILCKGPNVMLGYFKAPELTRQTIDQDGWLHTGDIGILVNEKYLKITDRKKEIFKLSSGKYIAPQVIENILKESPLIEQAFVVGVNEKFASALLSPNFNYLHFWANKHLIHFRDNAELIENPKVMARIQREVNKANKRLGKTEQIKRFRLVFEEWSPQSGELSATLKLKRKVLYDKYEYVLREIYSYSKTELNRANKDA